MRIWVRHNLNRVIAIMVLFRYKKKLSMDTTLLMCLRMVEALHYVHDAGYVHCDIKSANLLTTNKDKEVTFSFFKT